MDEGSGTGSGGKPVLIVGGVEVEPLDMDPGFFGAPEKFGLPNFTYLPDAELARALAAPGSLNRDIIANLLDRISEFDCEGWTADIGRAVVSRLAKDIGDEL